MNIQPIQSNILIEPIVEETAFSTAQAQYEERGRVIALAEDLVKRGALPPEHGGVSYTIQPPLAVNDIIYFDSWQASRFKDGAGKDVWIVHMDAVRAVEKNEPPLSK